jgi:hypothetical protein
MNKKKDATFHPWQSSTSPISRPLTLPFRAEENFDVASYGFIEINEECFDRI